MGWLATAAAGHARPAAAARPGRRRPLPRALPRPADDVAPTRLADIPDVADEPPSYAELLGQGGPSLTVLRARLDEAMRSLDPAASLGEVFDSLEPELRRPVEIFGLLHLAADRELPTEAEPRALPRRPPRRLRARPSPCPGCAGRPTCPTPTCPTLRTT